MMSSNKETIVSQFKWDFQISVGSKVVLKTKLRFVHSKSQTGVESWF